MTVPYVFTPGTVISSAQMNANFAAVGGGGTGVTDGSNAAAGQIGEYLESANSSAVYLTTSMTTGSMGSLASLSLTAGDWECGCNINFYNTASGTGAAEVGFGLSLAGAQPVDPGPRYDVSMGQNPGSAQLGSNSGCIAGWRVNTAAAASVTLMGGLGAGVTGTGNIITVWYRLFARRMR